MTTADCDCGSLCDSPSPLKATCGITRRLVGPAVISKHAGVTASYIMLIINIGDRGAGSISKGFRDIFKSSLSQTYGTFFTSTAAEQSYAQSALAVFAALFL